MMEIDSQDPIRWFAFANLYHVAGPLEGIWTPDEFSDDPEAGKFWDKTGEYSCPAEDGLVRIQPTVFVYSSENIEEVNAFIEGNKALRKALLEVVYQVNPNGEVA